MIERSPVSPSTRRLIRSLAAEVATGARPPILGAGGFRRAWFGGAAIVVALSIWLLPVRDHLRERGTDLSALTECALWAIAAILPARKAYTLAFPDLSTPERRHRSVVTSVLSVLPFLTLLTWSAMRMDPNDLGFQLYRESSPLNGGCGLVIFVAGALQGLVLFTWLRKGATSSPAFSGAWAALSTGAFASFIVQFACGNENTIHVVLWHLLPLALLTGVAALLGRFFLRW